MPATFARAFRFLLCLALLVSANSSLANLLAGEEPISAEEAFVPSIQHSNSNTIRIGFEIADGYYLYRDKTRVELVKPKPGSASNANSGAALATLNSPVFSAAVIKDDDFFGKQAVFRNKAIIDIPYTRQTAVRKLTLAVTFQGCADIGLCYPPTTTNLDVELPGSTETLIANDKSTPVMATPLAVATTSLTDLLQSPQSSDELLPPELAYIPSIKSATATRIQLEWFIEPGYYLYRDKLTFKLQDAGSAKIKTAILDSGTDQHDEFFGKVKVLREFAKASLELSPGAGASLPSAATLVINYQGCADIGVCFPPSVNYLPIAFTTAGQNISSADGDGSIAIFNPADAAEKPRLRLQSEQDRLKTMLGINSVWLNVATFFGLGLLLAFTPCVLPMVPILSSMIVGQGPEISTSKAFRLSLVYVLVMASTYAIVGIIVGLSGYNVQAFLQNPVVLTGIALLFVVLSLSMFGVYELQMPQGIQTKLTQWSNRQGGGQYAGVAAMGFISSLIVGPCVTAPLAGALIYIANTGDALIGGSALFALGLGMGAPLLLIGTSAGSLLPRAGAWMRLTQRVFGIMMLLMAIYLVSRFLPASITMLLYGVLALLTAVYMGATTPLAQDSSGSQRLAKGAGLAVGVYGLALTLGGLAGGNSYTAPLKGIFSQAGTQATVDRHGLRFAPVKSLQELQGVVARASSEGQPVMLDFYADWCISCKEMEAFTFTDKRVQALLSHAVLVQADVTANDATDQALLKHFDLFGPPGIIFYGPDGEEIPAARLVGFLAADKFSDHIERFF